MLDAVFGHVRQPFAALGVEGRFLFANAAFRELLGFENDELLGTLPPHPFWDPDSTSETLAKMQLLLSGDWDRLGAHSIEARLRRADGEQIDTLFVGGGLRHHGRLAGYGGFVIDLRGRSWRDRVAAVAAAVEQLGRGARVGLERRRGHVSEESGVDLDGITTREQDVLDLLLAGFRVRSIAHRLGLSEFTVRNHLKSLFRKVGVTSQAELIERCRGQRLDLA